MAIDTPTHREAGNLLNHIHLRNFAVTLLASHITIFGLAKTMHVSFVIKFHMIREHMNFHPIDGFTGEIFLLKLFDCRFVCGHKQVTIHTDIQAGNR
jgi:hypothetical protein